jgi:hypothetical protein
MNWFKLPDIGEGPPPFKSPKTKAKAPAKAPEQSVDEQGFVFSHRDDGFDADNTKFVKSALRTNLDEHDYPHLDSECPGWRRDVGLTQRIKNAWINEESAQAMERSDLGIGKRTAAKYIAAFYAADAERPSPLRPKRLA